jgi:peptidoglycan/LPS O-acetylase OafA/YrhL
MNLPAPRQSLPAADRIEPPKAPTGTTGRLRNLVAAISPPGIQVSRLLERDANNLDLIRLFCSCLVIFGHAFVVTPDPAWPAAAWDPTMHFGYPGVYSASVAVKIFFFISGILVTNSLLVRKSVSHYVIGRIFRIWPALAVVLLLTAFLIGPGLTSLPVRDYFSHYSVYHYVAGNLLMWMPVHLPGVFADNPLPALVNGALWTLPYEIAAYFALLLLAVLGVLRHRILCGLVLVLIVADPLLPHPLVVRWLEANPQFTYLPPCFALGAFVALCKDRLFVSPGIVAIAFAAFWVLRETAGGPLLYFFSLFVAVLYVSGLPWIRKIRLKSDISYGTFIWGFVIQQMVAGKFHDRGLPFNLGASLALALFMGFLSWHLIEKPAIRLGRRLADRWTGGPPPIPPAGERNPDLTP